jgi:hypothetical protein
VTPAAAALCIALAGSAAGEPPVARLPLGGSGDGFSLAWTHSVEKIEWREDWLVADHRLVLMEAHVRGNGAGMDVPEGAELIDGSWVYRPKVAPLERLTLANSSFTADYRLCAAGKCRALADITHVADKPLTLSACPEP